MKPDKIEEPPEAPEGVIVILEPHQYEYSWESVQNKSIVWEMLDGYAEESFDPESDLVEISRGGAFGTPTITFQQRDGRLSLDFLTKVSTLKIRANEGTDYVYDGLELETFSERRQKYVEVTIHFAKVK